MVYIISGILKMVGDIDTVDTKVVGDKTYVTFTTTCLRGEIGAKLVDLKMKLYMLLDIPIKWASVSEKKRTQDNILFSEYIITMEVPTKGLGKSRREKIFGKLPWE